MKNTSNASNTSSGNGSRRQFCKTSALLTGGALLPRGLTSMPYFANNIDMKDKISAMDLSGPKSIIGPYGPWLAQMRQDPGDLSFRHEQYSDVIEWKNQVMPVVESCIARPNLKVNPEPKITARYQYDGLDIEEMEWALPYGHPTKAVLLKPAGATGPLPGILGLHDHGGNKYLGLRKITRTSDEMHPTVVDHQALSYEGIPWANELAKRGYVVLVHDVFTFGSRRVRFSEMLEIPWGYARTAGHTDDDPENPDHIQAYNSWAGSHEHVMAKSLFSGGTTWPGMFLQEDQIALSVLAAREEVDEERLGCGGLSGGGLRTDFLSGLDHRIKCAVSVGFMSTWDDFMLHKSYTHTWMTYVPILPQFLDFSEIVTLRMPLPTLVQSNNEDNLYTLPEMKRAARFLEENYTKAGAPEAISCRFYPGGHKFDKEMQADAFDWFDQWLT